MKSPFKSSAVAAGLATAAVAHKPAKAKSRRNFDKKHVSCTYNLSPEMYRKLQEIKLERGTSLQALLDEAVDHWLASIGETGFKR